MNANDNENTAPQNNFAGLIGYDQPAEDRAAAQAIREAKKRGQYSANPWARRLVETEGDGEEQFELQAAFGRGAVVVNVITGERKVVR